ncbi:GDSL esterase/lipase EXL2-like, partial [Oryza brachyantha]|uniref:GDSL esterase/lipase EXL2-like n=1 Tax=Oryza brachyantha TaxID=4533 RepID=UPI00077672E6
RLATGRLSNGNTMGDIIASRYGVKELIPPYLADGLQLEDLLSGVAFASGGSGYDPLTSKITTAMSSTQQLQLFEAYKEKLVKTIGQEAAAQVITDSIYFTSMGGNDLANNYFLIPFKQHQYDLGSYVDFLVSSAVNFILKMNQIGAKKIGFFGMPPVGCSPSQIILGGHPSKECFKEATEGCCSSTLLDATIFIAYHTACSNVLDYVSWDGFHPTEKAYKTPTVLWLTM